SPPAITVDRVSPVPLYFQVSRQIEHAIETGELAPGYRFPNEITLADQLGLSRPTMRRAIQELVGKGLLVRKRGVGTQVVHNNVRREVKLTSLYDDLARTGQSPTTRVLHNAIDPAPPDVASEMGVAEDTPLRHFERLRFARAEPLAILRNWLPEHLLNPTDDELRERGLYEMLRGNGVRMHIAHQRIGARGASSAEGRLLGLRKNAPLLSMQRSAYDDHGNAIEYGTHVYLPEGYSFEVTLVES